MWKDNRSQRYSYEHALIKIRGLLLEKSKEFHLSLCLIVRTFIRRTTSGTVYESVFNKTPP